MKLKKILSAVLGLALAATTLCGCKGDAGKDDGVIKVGIINNDPNESGYRTANDKAMRDMFTEANGYSATFYNNNDAA